MKTSHLHLNFLFFLNERKGMIAQYIRNSINNFWVISSERRISTSWMSRYKVIEHEQWWNDNIVQPKPSSPMGKLKSGEAQLVPHPKVPQLWTHLIPSPTHPSTLRASLKSTQTCTWEEVSPASKLKLVYIAGAMQIKDSSPWPTVFPSTRSCQSVRPLASCSWLVKLSGLSPSSSEAHTHTLSKLPAEKKQQPDMEVWTEQTSDS